MWKYYCPGKYKNEGDCTVRALCKALGIDWLSAYDLLVSKGRDMQRMPDSIETIKGVLSDFDFVYTGLKIERGKRRPTVADFASAHPTGRYVLSVASHMVTVINGDWYDTWDCGGRCVYSYWSG